VAQDKLCTHAQRAELFIYSFMKTYGYFQTNELFISVAAIYD
jgi:hypothetical protein